MVAGLKEFKDPDNTLPKGRVRRPDGGRKKQVDRDIEKVSIEPYNHDLTKSLFPAVSMCMYEKAGSALSPFVR